MESNASARRGEEYGAAIREYLPPEKQQQLLSQLASQGFADKFANATLDQIFHETRRLDKEAERCIKSAGSDELLLVTCRELLDRSSMLLSWALLQRTILRREYEQRHEEKVARLALERERLKAMPYQRRQTEGDRPGRMPGVFRGFVEGYRDVQAARREMEAGIAEEQHAERLPEQRDEAAASDPQESTALSEAVGLSDEEVLAEINKLLPHQRTLLTGKFEAAGLTPELLDLLADALDEEAQRLEMEAERYERLAEDEERQASRQGRLSGIFRRGGLR